MRARGGGGGAGNIPACSNLDDTLHYYVPADSLTEACGTRWRGGTQHHSHPPLVLCRGGSTEEVVDMGKKTKGIAVALVHSLTDTALAQLCEAALVLVL